MSGIIDLTESSPEPGETSSKILSGFQPRKNKEKQNKSSEISGYGQKTSVEATPLGRTHDAAQARAVSHDTNSAAGEIPSGRLLERTDRLYGGVDEIHQSYLRDQVAIRQALRPGSFYSVPGSAAQLEAGVQQEPAVLQARSKRTIEHVGDILAEKREQAHNDFRAKEAARRSLVKQSFKGKPLSRSHKRGSSPPLNESKLLKKPRRISASNAGNTVEEQHPHQNPLLASGLQNGFHGRDHISEVKHRDEGISTQTLRSTSSLSTSAVEGPHRPQNLHTLYPSHDERGPSITSRPLPQYLPQPTATQFVSIPYTAEEDAALIRLKAEGKRWHEIASFFPTRSQAALQTRYSSKLQERASENFASVTNWRSGQNDGLMQQPLGQRVVLSPASHPTTYGRAGWCLEDDVLLSKLKELDNLSWSEIGRYFPRRTHKAVEQRYFQRVKGKSMALKAGQKAGNLTALLARRQATYVPIKPRPPSSSSSSTGQQLSNFQGRKRPRRIGTKTAPNGFVSWTEAEERMKGNKEQEQVVGNSIVESVKSSLNCQDRIFPSTLLRILRERTAGRHRGVSDELKNNVFNSYGLQRYFDGTSGDVHCLAWHPDGKHFAAGSIAVSDPQSLQYNKGLNLLAGEIDADIHELQEHHTDRPFVVDANDLASSHAMRESQDPRLFMTVSAIGFHSEPGNDIMYTAGYDRKVHVYSVGNLVQHQYEIHHSANIDLLDISGQGLLATGCAESQESTINVFKCSQKAWQPIASFSSEKQNSTFSLLPRALKWGNTFQYQDYLLAGFSGQWNDDSEQYRLAGDIGLWSFTTDDTVTRIRLDSVGHGVFDVAWNPAPSSASTIFAAACGHKAYDMQQPTRTVIQCYSPSQLKQPVMSWQCPASDINDVLYCPHDGNLLSAGATDGKVYVWDQRFASKSRRPLHVLSHLESLNVLPHDQDRELADTGVRFLSWGATSSRLYSGSSDGLVRVWNPYRAPGDALVDTVASFGSAIMSGSFSPDYHELLIGEEKGRLNVLSVGHGDGDNHKPTARAFNLRRAEQEPDFMPETYFATAEDMVENGEIEYRSMGALPVRQAVQGPKYAGPYFKPTQADWEQATNALTHAKGEWEKLKLAQDEAQLDPDESEDEVGLQRAANRVEVAENRIQTLRSREQEFPKHAARARATQQAFLTAEDSVQTSSQCTLDCNFLPSHAGYDRDDSNRSAQRIPGAMRAMRALPRLATDVLGDVPSMARHSVGVAEMTCSQLHHLGLTSACPHCALVATSKNKQFKALQERLCKARLHRLKAGLTQSCVKCGATVVPASDAVAIHRCERCNFACLRCSRRAKVSARTSTLECEFCGLSYHIGVLGYEICDEFVFRPHRPPQKEKTGTVVVDGRMSREGCDDHDDDGNDDDGDDDDAIESIGDAEREHYASLWDD
nr:rik1-associated factor 1 [Quercus suber]